MSGTKTRGQLLAQLTEGVAQAADAARRLDVQIREEMDAKKDTALDQSDWAERRCGSWRPPKVLAAISEAERLEGVASEG